MGTRSYLWHFILSVVLCTETAMASEGRDATAATPESHANVLGSTNNNRPEGPGDSSNASTAEPSPQTDHSLLGTTLLSPTTMRIVGGRMDTTSTMPAWEGGSLGVSARSNAVSPAFPTTGPGTTAPSMGTEGGTEFSLSLSSAVMSHSSSSSPEGPVASTSGTPSVGSSAVTPSPQRSSTSGTTETPLATPSHPPTALVFSSPSSTAGITSAQFPAVTAEAMTQGPTTPRPVASTSGTSPASGTIEDRLPPTLGRNTETSTADLTSTPLTQGQATVEATATSSPMGSPLPSVNMASVGSSATTPPGEGESPTMNQGSRMTTDPNVQTSHFFPATSLVSPSTMRMVSGEGRTDTTPTTPVREGSSLGTSPGSGAVSRAFPTTGPGSTAPGMGTESGTASSLPLSSAVTSHSSSSPKGSPAVTPSPQQSSTSGTTETLLATTSHPPTALVFSSPSSTAGITGVESDAVTAEPIRNSPAPSTPSTNPVASTSGTPSVGSSAVTPSPQQSSTSGTTETPLAATSHPPTALVFSTAGVTGMESDAVTAEEVTPSPALSTASTNPVASASVTSPASGITESSHSPPLSSSTETPAPRHTSTLLTQGQTTVEVTGTSSPTGTPLSSTTTASVGSSATTPPGEGESSTMNQGSRTTAEPTAKTSHSLPSTTSATPSTTNHSTSTSVNPSFTGTCSPITLSIQLHNVTSRTIQFSWKPEGGTGDGPYTVRLLGKSGETEERILNGTSTAFVNLLSGHRYQISVDVSTCSKNVSTSLTVQTAAEVYNGTTRITNEVFIPAYQNKSSREFMEFENKFITEITKHLPQKIQELKNGTKLRIVINSIEEGSVIVLFDIVLDVEQNITKPEVSEAFTEALNRSTVFEVDLKKTVVEARNSCQPGLNDCDQNAACTAEGATYSCRCNKGFTDKSPQVPGRVCQRDLPSQQTTPVPPDTNTTKTTGSTGSKSNSVFATTFTSAPCMPVSVEVQNVTAEEIQLSWTSGSKGSLYNVSVRDGNQEINKTTTEETKAVFKHLLPGHVYTISVAVSSCAENSQTSVTVRTDPASCFKRTEFCSAESSGCSDLKDIVCSKNQALACSVLLRNQTFNNTLYNSDSEDYKTMAERIITDVVGGMRAELNNDRFDIVVLGFRPGSVVVDFLSLLPKEEPVDVDFIQTSLSKILRNKFGNQTAVTVQSLSVRSSTDNCSSWRVAVIVLGVLLGVALVLILLAILFYIYVRRRSGIYFEQQILIASKAF